MKNEIDGYMEKNPLLFFSLPLPPPKKDRPRKAEKLYHQNEKLQ